MKKMILFFTLVLTITLFSNTSYDEFFQKVEILKEKIKNGDKKAINNLENDFMGIVGVRNEHRHAGTNRCFFWI